MALVADGYELRVKLRGSSTKTSTLTFDLRAADHATALTDSLTIIAAVNTMTAAVITGYTVATKYTEDTLVIPAAVDLTDVAVITGEVDGFLDKYASVRVPGFDRTEQVTLLQATTGRDANKLIITGAPLAYWNLFASGGEAYISDGEDAGAISAGRLISRGSPNP